MPLFLFIFHIFYNIQYRHSFNHIHTIHLSVAIRWGFSPYPHRFVSSVGKTSLWCRAENRTRASLTASRRATNWATPHHDWATPHHDWATPHHTEPRRTSSFIHLLLQPPQYGPWNLPPQMALAYQLDAISQGPKTSQFPGPSTLPLALIMDMHASKTLCTGLYKS